MESLNIQFSNTPTSELMPICEIEVGETWDRIKRMNLEKPPKMAPNVVLFDRLAENGDIEDTEVVTSDTARWFLGDFWKLPKAVKALDKAVAQATLESKILRTFEELRNHAPTYVIANQIGMRGQTPKVLKALKRMKEAGVVKKHPDSIVNGYVWARRR